MSPACTSDDALVMPPRLSALAAPHLREVAQRFIDDPDATDPAALSDLFSPDRAPPGFPARSGYCLGLRIAEKLGAHRSLRQLAHLRGAKLKNEILNALTRLRNGD